MKLFDCRYQSRPLYAFSLEPSLPAAEKLIFILICSFSPKDLSDERFLPSDCDLQSLSNLPWNVVQSICINLEATGLIVKSQNHIGEDVYQVEPLIPLFHAYREHSLALSVGDELTEGEHKNLDFVSREIMKKARAKSFLRKERLATMFAEWSQDERSRNLTRIAARAAHSITKNGEFAMSQ